MITFSRMGRMGNLGNMLHQIAFTWGLATKHDCGIQMPKWEYAKYFKNYGRMILEYEQAPEIELSVKEEHFHYNPELWQQYETDFRTRNVDLIAWGQSRKYWGHCREDIAKLFEFNHVFSMGLFQKCAVVSYDKPVIAISVRRGDYVNNPNYDLLPASYYIQALLEHFPNFREEYNLIFFSDDMEYCKLHFSCLPNAHFTEGYNAIEQLCLMSMCEHAIIANSTFSWWGAMLIQFNSKYAKIIRPGYLFAGNLLETHDDRDFWPNEWIRHDHKNNKINLKDVTFTIPVSYDSRDRKENLDMCLKYLSDFDTTIIIGEHGPHPRFEYTRETGCQYMRFDMQAFHRTKMLNDMALAAKTSIVANWDADVIVPPMQLIEAVHKIKTRQAQMVYPYDGQFARVPRQQWYQQVMKMGDVGVFAGQKFQGMGNAPKSVGGAILWDMEAFVDCGLENERMVSYAPEDAERYYRAEKLGVKVHRVDGVIYHLDHLITNNSSIQHEHYRDNMIEYHTIKGMSKEELRTCVDGWPWKKNYTPLYYESIFEESVKSRDAVFGILKSYGWGWLKANTVVVDVGGALGQWGYNVEEEHGVNYFCIDYGVPLDKLVIDKNQYIDHNLENPITRPIIDEWFGSDFKAYLVMCLECAEHIDEKYADQLVDSLCELGDNIMFSAAIPGQGGLHHKNEQMQSYWAYKFFERGYALCLDDIRQVLRDDENVSLWYRNNLMLFHKVDGETIYPPEYSIDFVHPQMYKNVLKHYRIIK